MKKSLVAYFSVSGVTKRLAEALSKVTNANLFEIKPAVPYNQTDLDWTNKKSRSSIEMNNPNSRPEIANKVENMAQYDTVFIGFPIWWYVAPTIINTFLEQYDLTGKKIIPFATSGGSGMGNTNKVLKHSCVGAELLDGKCFSKGVSETELKDWVSSLNC